MLKEYKNVKVNYEADAIIEINTKEYRIMIVLMEKTF